MAFLIRERVIGMSCHKPIAEERAIAECGDAWVAVVVHGIRHQDRIAPRLAIVRGVDGHDAPALRPIAVRLRDVSISRVENAEQIT